MLYGTCDLQFGAIETCAYDDPDQNPIHTSIGSKVKGNGLYSHCTAFVLVLSLVVNLI
jgi:hypothetical protein